MGSSQLRRVASKPGKQHRRPRFSSTHNVKHPADNGLSTGYPPHPYRPCRPPRLREARGISPCLFSRQPPFSNFFQRSAEGRKTSKKSRRLLSRAHCGAREKTVRSAGGGDIRPSYTWRKRFLVRKQLIRRFPQDSLAQWTSQRKGRFSRIFCRPSRPDRQARACFGTPGSSLRHGSAWKHRRARHAHSDALPNCRSDCCEFSA